uniref:hypothetical protein n=1 Tax=Rhodohalobacter sp. 8-1 TaxID=3131972 RepID=UPI0030EC271E
MALQSYWGSRSWDIFLKDAAITFKQLKRTVTVIGLAEQEHPADVVIWPIQYTEAGNTLIGTYTALETSDEKVRAFLVNQGISEEELYFSTPVLTDRSAQL